MSGRGGAYTTDRALCLVVVAVSRLMYLVTCSSGADSVEDCRIV